MRAGERDDWTDQDGQDDQDTREGHGRAPNSQDAQEGAVAAASVGTAPPVRGPEPRGPVWVEELAGPEDFWLTLTDAARVTRRQEVTIRRWVAAGSLPIRNRPLGINKRTRHVRASDLAQLSPIVDASATISGTAAQIDLLSIPEQQAQIRRRQRELDQQAETLAAQVEQVGHAAGTQQSRLDEHHDRLAAIESAATTLRSELATGNQQAEKRYAAIGRRLSALQQTVDHLGKDAKALRDEQQEARSIQERIAERQVEQETEQQSHREHLQLLEKQLEKQQRQGVRDRGQLQRRLDEEAQRMSALVQQHQRVDEGVAQLREELRQQDAAAQRQASELAKQLQTVQEYLRDAEVRSRTVADLFSQEQERVRQLAAQVATLTAQMAAPAPVGEPAKKVRRRRAKQPVSTSTA